MAENIVPSFEEFVQSIEVVQEPVGAEGEQANVAKTTVAEKIPIDIDEAMATPLDHNPKPETIVVESITPRPMEDVMILLLDILGKDSPLPEVGRDEDIVGDAIPQLRRR